MRFFFFHLSHPQAYSLALAPFLANHCSMAFCSRLGAPAFIRTLRAGSLAPADSLLCI
ncbi:hypothetical protein AG1IA_09670 [Rhizoctonia solani AG-1 IA]|uniref:Uncharacterized protein n=1 Tax=Thanatephorus cucumeris (strain AG1-IA) TaxID=983506 RepID=L8WIY4_THACA|nr:hypothetical protein AG1IA_09670 [Rhizoctonia solani AG-1 IA]